MKLVLGSDLHGFLPEVPQCDFLILAGDILPDIDQKIFVDRKLKPWLEQAPAKNVIATWGNHDWLPFYGWSSDKLRWHALIDESVVIAGLKFYGSPWSLPFMRWAWMAPEKTLARLYETIPQDTNILITHSPPFGILDRNLKMEHCGSKALMAKLGELPDLKLVVCGHIHEARGKEGIVVNASCIDGTAVMGYRLHKNPWIEIEL